MVLFIFSFVVGLSDWAHLDMAAVAIAEVSKVKGQRVWSNSPLHHKAQVGFMSTSGPAHIFVMVNELFSGQKHTETENSLLLRRDCEIKHSPTAEVLFILTETRSIISQYLIHRHNVINCQWCRGCGSLFNSSHICMSSVIPCWEKFKKSPVDEAQSSVNDS